MADNALNVAAEVHEPSQKIPGQRPGSWLHYSGGYMYRVNKTTNDKRYLICAQSRCRAKAWMRLEENAPIFLSGVFEHAHLPDYEKAPKMQFLHNVKKRSREETDRSINSILMDESLRNQETAVTLSKLNTIRAMKNARLHNEPPLPLTFGANKHRGCWFHYCQAIWRKAGSYGLWPACRENPDVFEAVKMVMALPHLPAMRGPPNSMEIPPYSIADGLGAIANVIEDEQLDRRLDQLVNYVQRFWLGRVGATLLSVFNMPRRTNNCVESFNASMLLSLDRRKNAWTFVRGLQGIEQEAFLDAQRLVGNVPARRPPANVQQLQTASVQQSMARLCQGAITLERCLRRLSHLASNFGNVAAAVGGDELEEEEEEAAPPQPLNWDELMGVDVIAEEEVVAE